MAGNDEPEYLTVQQIADRFGIHKATVHRWLNQKRITGKKFGRATRVNLRSVLDYIDRQPDR